MTLIRLLLLILLAPAACAHLPRLDSLPPDLAAEARSRCTDLYPQGDWQLVHSIGFVTPDGGRSTMMGITQLSSTRRIIHCVLLTLEGLVLFEARCNDGDIQVRRALPPFDKPAFSRGLFDDIMLMLMPPATVRPEFGRQAAGDLVCRWYFSNRTVQDNVILAEQAWEIRRYNEDLRLIRLIAAAHDERSTKSNPMPAVVSLKASGLLGYELTLKLLEASQLEASFFNEMEVR